MKSRIFLFALLFACMLPTVAAEDGRQYYELRVYTTKSEKQQKLVNDYWQNSAVPAYNRMGVKPIGVFTELEDSPTNRIFVLIPFNSLEQFSEAASKLAADSAYQKDSAEFMNLPKNDPPYVKFDSSLLLAMKSAPKLELPPSSAEKKPWIFELRTYTSSTEAKGINKVEMFNSGEVPVMKEVGLSPVFFAQAIVGTQLPSLTYMVSGENKEEHKKHWGGFGPNAVWQKLSKDPQYKDNVSSIISTFLKRTSASQI
jgi:hypothetical protein